MSKEVTITVFRSGLLVPAGDHALTCPPAVLADQLMPDEPGRAGRTTGLFCAPDLEQLATWHHANSGLEHAGYAAKATEIRYRGPEPYAYPVHAWNSRSLTRSGEDALAGWWHTGLPVREALADPDRFVGEDSDERRIEVLVDPAYIISARPVSLRRLILAADLRTAERLEQTYRRRQWFKGNTWRDYRAAAA